MAIIQIPVLFDMSGDSIVFGEEVTGDFVGSHLEFLLDMTTETNGISLTAADISSAIFIGDQDSGDNIFYSGGTSGNIAVDNLCNRIAKAITRGKLVHIPKTGNSSNSGIPMGGRLYVVDSAGQQQTPPNGKYAEKYPHSVAPIGDEQMLGEAMARVASVHLMGTPLAAGILVDKNSVQTDLETASAQTFGSTAFYNALAVQLSKVLGGSKSSAPMNNGAPPPPPPAGPDDLTSNHYSEDFEDQTYTGHHTDGTVIAGGFNGSNFCLKGRDADPSQDGTVINEWQTTASNIRGISFWFKPDFTNQGSHSGHICVMRLHTGVTGANGQNFTPGTSELAWLAHPFSSDDNGMYMTCPTGICAKLFINGVPRKTFVNDSGRFRAPSLQEVWNHVYVEYSAIQNNTSVIFLQGGGGSTVAQPDKYNLYGTAASIDDVRFFNDSLTEAQIGDLAAGGNGNGTPVATINGEALMVDMGENVVVSSYKVHPKQHASDITKIFAPKTGKLLYSTDGYKYYLAHDFDAGTVASGYGSVGNYTSVDNNFDEVTARYFKFVTETLYTSMNTGMLAIAQLEIIGTRASDAAGTAAYNVAVSTVAGMTHTYTSTNRGHNSASWHADKAFDGDTTGSYWLSGIQDYHYDGTTGLPRYRLLEAGRADVTLHNYYEAASGGSSASYPLDASGTSVPALKSIYEQLMNVPGRSQIMETRDVSGVVDNSNVNLAGGFPFISGDKLVMYLRPKIVFAAQTQTESHNALYTFNYSDTPILAVPVYNIADSTGSITAQTYTQSSSQAVGWGFAAAVDGTGVAGQPYFTTAGGTYNNTTGVHEGAGQTTNVDGSTTLDGEWGQVDIGENTFVKELALTTNNTYNFRSPTEFRLLGSADGTNWKTMIHETGIATWLDDTPRTYQNLVATPYRYYRYVVITIDSVHGNTDLRTSLGHFNLRGVKFPSEVVATGDLMLMGGSSLDISGLQTNVTPSSANVSDAFPGNANAGPESEISKWGWMGSANSDSLTLDSTDVTDPRTIDLHIWKITITL